MPADYYLGKDFEGYLCVRTSADSDKVLGCMDIEAPDALTGALAMVMMSVLLFLERPRDVVMAGLGAGSLAKYILKNLHATHVTAVEIDADMVSIARRHFHVPEDNERFTTVVADIREYLPRHPASCDIILSDVFENDVVPAALLTADYYAECHQALRPGGILLINIMGLSIDKLTEQIALLQPVFRGGVLMIPLIDHVNTVLFCFRDPPCASWEQLEERANRLEPQLGLGLPAFVRDLKIRAGLLQQFAAAPSAPPVCNVPIMMGR